MVSEEELVEKATEKIKESIEEVSDLYDGTLDKELEEWVMNSLAKSKDELDFRDKEKLEEIVKNLKRVGFLKLRSSEKYGDLYIKDFAEETNQPESNPITYLTFEEMNSFTDKITRASDTKTFYFQRRKLNEREREILYT